MVLISGFTTNQFWKNTLKEVYYERIESMTISEYIAANVCMCIILNVLVCIENTSTKSTEKIEN